MNFLDVTLDLKQESHAPYKKPNDTTLYIHKDSNHPPSVIKQVPQTINDRLNNISSNEELFNQASPEYQRALDASGYKHKLKYERKERNKNTNNSKKQEKKKRNIVYFTPPFSKNVKTNVGKSFLKLIDKHFPTGHKLKKAVNRNCVKITYSTTPNIRTIIQAHNAKILQNASEETSPKVVIDDPQQTTNTLTSKTCNCNDKNNCPLDGNCNPGPIIYKATIQDRENNTYTYIGSTQNFKERYNNHKKSFRHEKYKKETTLSSFIWEKNLEPEPNVKWEIVKQGHVYRKGGRYCDLCLSEKLYISKNLKTEGCLNKRTELTSKCRHKDRFKLSRIKF